MSCLTQSCQCHLKSIQYVALLITIDRDTCHHVVRCLVTSRLDYCNSLLYGITKAHLKRLTGIQYRAAKLVNCWRAHGSPLLAQLHWLPIEKRIQFKTLLYVFKCLNDIAPPYLSDMFHLHQSNRQGLRSSSDRTRLTTHKSRLSYGKHAFSHSAAELWNSLPIIVRDSSCVVTFKSKLKTYLFPNV